MLHYNRMDDPEEEEMDEEEGMDEEMGDGDTDENE